MCSKSTRRSSMKKQKPKSTRNPPRKTTPLLNSSRKSRTKTRKHKFLSLKTELSKTESPSNSNETSTTTTTVEENKNQLNLFPLYPENLFEEKETQDENVDYFFDSEGGATLNGFVWGENERAGAGLASDQEDSLTYAYQGQDSEEGGGGTESLLMRNALRQRVDRDESEEKWVCYEEVVEKKEEESSSCSTQQEYPSLMHQGLCLKLDHQKIMKAWSDKGPLYISGDCSQVVPDVLDEPPAQDSSNVLGDGKVPVWRSLDDGTDTVDGGEGGYQSQLMKMGEREARVLRYKEKRQSRLFSKRIRYEVRKLNAEKRPRMKGRFVKRS